MTSDTSFKKKRFKLKYSQKFNLFIGLAVIIVIISPLLVSSSLPWGDDIYYHLLRIEGIKDGILTGQFPVKIDPTFFNGGGYASSLFYPNILLYIPAFLRILGFSITASYKIFIILIVTAGYLTAYFCAKNISKSRYAAMISAIIFSLSQYHLINIYMRAALGEIQAYIFLPLVVWGLYDLLQEGFKKPYILGIGFLGLVYCHVISFAMTAILTFFILLFNLKVFIQDKKLILKLFITAGIVFLLSLAFLGPLFEQWFSQRFNFHTPWSIVSERATIPGILFYNKLTYFNGVYVFYTFGISIPLFCLVRLWLKKNKENFKMAKTADIFLFIGFFILFMSTSLFPWKLFESYLSFLQFPFRLYFLASMFLALAIGILCNLVFKGKERGFVLFAILFILTTNFFTELSDNPLSYVNIPDNYYTQVEKTFDIGAGEWLPEYANIYIYENTKVVFDNLDSETGNKHGVKLTFNIEKGHKYCDVPLIYYKGYSAVLTDSKGNKTSLPVSGEGEGKKIRITLPENAEGTVVVNYTGTTIQTVTGIISLATLISLAAVFFVKIIKRANFPCRSTKESTDPL